MGPLKKPPFSGQSSILSFDSFFIIKRITETDENFGNVSPFLAEKAITGSVAIVTSTKLMRSGDLLVEPHLTLNTSKGVIKCGRLLNLSIEQITQELSGQGVKDVRCINICSYGKLVPTKHFILTFNTPRLPEYIKAGYVRCSVKPYIPNPLRCFKYQRFGHSKTRLWSGRGILTCARCAVAGHESTGCTAVEKCVNCQGEYTPFSRSCPKWDLEKEIVTLMFKNNISFPEARRLVKAQTPIEGRSHASVVDKNHPVYQNSHCHHAVTMSNFPSASKSSELIASSSVTANRNISLQSSSKTPEVSPASQHSSAFQIV
ncbi:hypothetical protein AVEN_194442-1 [Araneus ventricosus]|uniref:Uncharacterized protein n=1 Tax=Araneus ventricosus TaxID=182803 RepID=A0A4Y2A8F2_ARAVE|nr:hypothetical protein AVEN_194442-1 [Araneus ventricosus]